MEKIIFVPNFDFLLIFVDTKENATNDKKQSVNIILIVKIFTNL